MNASTPARTDWPRRAIYLGLICLLALLTCLPAGQAQAKGGGPVNRYVRTNGNDLTPDFNNNNCMSEPLPCKTIQHAVGQSNEGGDTIYLYGSGGTPGDYQFEEQVTIDKNNLTIIGVSPFRGGKIFIDAGGAAGLPGGGHNRVLTLLDSAPNFTLKNIVLQNANTAMKGGGVYIAGGASGSVSFENVIVQDNILPGYDGGGIYLNDGFLILDRVIVRDNSTAGTGGGIFVSANANMATITNCTFSGNHSNQGGGANFSGPTSVTNSTFSGNVTTSLGGGIYIIGAEAIVSVTNATITNNSAHEAAGIMADSSSQLVLNHVTISDNHADEGYVEGLFSTYNTRLSNTIVTQNLGSFKACSDNGQPGTLVSLGHNLSNDDTGTCNFTAEHDVLTIDAKLSPLANNGGYTQTMALLPGSPAIDAADGSAPATDQRGKPRDNGDYSGKKVADIGAYEFQVPNHNYMPYGRR